MHLPTNRIYDAARFHIITTQDIFTRARHHHDVNQLMIHATQLQRSMIIRYHPYRLLMRGGSRERKQLEALHTSALGGNWNSAEGSLVIASGVCTVRLHMGEGLRCSS